MLLLKRYLLFTVGLCFMSLGICMIIASNLGSSPISSVPYILEFCYPFTLGEYTLIINLLFIFAEILILRRRFEYIQLLQIPVTIVFSFLLDIVMNLLVYIPVTSYAAEIAILLAGCCFLAFGVTCEVIANVVMLAGEGIVNAIATNWKLDFGYTKVGFDCFLVLTSVIISLVYLQEIRGIREGTLISALIVGHIVRFLLRTLSYPDAQGNLHFKNPFRQALALTDKTAHH